MFHKNEKIIIRKSTWPIDAGFAISFVSFYWWAAAMTRFRSGLKENLTM